MADAKKTAKIVLDKLGGWFGGARKSSGSLGFILTCAFLIHLWDVLNNFRDFGPRLMWYIILIIFAWLTIFKKEVGVIDIADLKVPVILSSIAFFIPYLGNVLPFIGNSQVFQTIIIFCPAWVVYLAFSMGETLYTNMFRWGIIIFWIVLLLPILTANLAADLHLGDVETGINVQQTISNARRDFSSGVRSIFNNIGKSFRDTINNIIKIGAGDYYTGRVDEYENEPVGVYLEDLEAADSKFFEGEKITVWAVLKAKTLDNEININVSCYAKEGDKKIEGNITPQNEFNIAGEEEEYLDCVFDKLNPGKMDVTFNAEFNFETMAYLKTYLMDKERLRAFKRDGIDVFIHYKISHINPIAIYTNGPIGIGMRTAEPLPVGIYSDKDNIPFFFGITIENNWEGIIKKITDLEVQVHDSLELTNCDHEFEFRENEDGYNIYGLVPDKRTENIKTGKFHSIKCRLYPLDPRSLLGNEPITTRYFRVTANYIYELEKSTPVEIEEVREYKSPEEDVMTEESKIEELKNQPEIKEICEDISKCEDYNLNYYDKLGFSDQVWCDTDPCDLNCYPSFKEEGSEIYYDSCKECNPIYDEYEYYIQVERDSFCDLYLTKEYCDKDPCDSKYSSGGISYTGCSWKNEKCVKKTAVEEEWKVYREYSKEEIIEKITNAAYKYSIPPYVALAIAHIESGFIQWEEEGKILKNSCGVSCEAIGIMQIRVDEGYCSSCSLEEEELYDIDNNIDCGVRMLKSKHDTFCDKDGNLKIKTSGESIYESSVRKNCYTPAYINKYLSYEGDCWAMAARYYNGLGCVPEPSGDDDVKYVDKFNDALKLYKMEFQ